MILYLSEATSESTAITDSTTPGVTDTTTIGDTDGTTTGVTRSTTTVSNFTPTSGELQRYCILLLIMKTK
jgi:hypothetical protein